MRNLKRASVAIVALALVAGCPPPDPNNPVSKYQPGYTTVTIVKAVVNAGYSTFLGVESALREDCNKQVCSKLHPDPASQAYKDCMAQDHSAVAEWKTCYGKMAEAKPIVDKAVPLARSLVDEVKAALDFAVQYEIAKTAKAKASDPAKLKEFCDKVFPYKVGDEYQKCIAGLPLKKADWSGLLKKGSCLVYNSLAFTPTKYAKYVGPISIWFKGYGNCP